MQVVQHQLSQNDKDVRKPQRLNGFVLVSVLPGFRALQGASDWFDKRMDLQHFIISCAGEGRFNAIVNHENQGITDVCGSILFT